MRSLFRMAKLPHRLSSRRNRLLQNSVPSAVRQFQVTTRFRSPIIAKLKACMGIMALTLFPLLVWVHQLWRPRKGLLLFHGKEAITVVTEAMWLFSMAMARRPFMGIFSL